jgi:hypothetical protein
METAALNEETSRNFHLFWDNFPFPVMLVHRNRTILDRNKAAEAVGLTTGTRCVDLGNKEDHKGCLANKALDGQTPMRTVAYVEAYGAVLDSYWIPLAGEKDLYIHYSADISAYAAESMFPLKVEAGPAHGCSSCSCS